GREAASVRRIVGDLRAEADTLLRSASIGQPLADAFDALHSVGASFATLDRVRRGLLAEAPVYLPSVLVVQASVRLCLATQARVVAGMAFTAREQVDSVAVTVNDAFDAAEEI